MTMRLLGVVAALMLAGCAKNAAVAVAAASPQAIKGIHHVGITVADIDDTVAFYSKVVPYEIIARRMVNASAFPAEVLDKRSGTVEIALIRTPTVFLQLIDVEPGRDALPNRQPVIGPGYTHICFQSPDTAPKYAAFKAAGLDMLSRGDGPVDLGGYGVTYAYGFDPNGIMIEMEQLSAAIIASHGEMGRRRMRHPAWPTHVANVAGDKAAMVEFYTRVLGYGPRRELPPTRRKTFDEVTDIDNVEVAASWFDVGNFELEFWTYVQPPTPTRFTRRVMDDIGYNSIMFETSDLAGTVARLEAEGVTFAGKAVELGGWRLRYARDPEGNLLGFQQNLNAGKDRSIDAMLWLKDRSTP